MCIYCRESEDDRNLCPDCGRMVCLEEEDDVLSCHGRVTPDGDLICGCGTVVVHNPKIKRFESAYA